jgi:hypothetical protein
MAGYIALLGYKKKLARGIAFHGILKGNEILARDIALHGM